MELIDLEHQYQYREENMQVENRNKMQDILKYFFYMCKSSGINYQNSTSLWENFILNYRKLVERGLQSDINLYLRANGAKENAFLYEALHNRESDSRIKNLLTKKDNTFCLAIGNKEIEFMNASEYFTNTELEEFFKNKKLEGECFDRTLELVSSIKNSRAVVSYLPNLFAGGYYHAFVACPNDVLVDPASNLVLLNDDAKNLLAGQVVFSMNYDEIKNSLELLNTIDGIKEYDRPVLLKLALFYECNILKTEEIEEKNKLGR